MISRSNKQLHIANLGVIDVALPVIQIGSGNPKALVINNMHGNELTGFYVLEKLMSILPDKILGSIDIITTANPLGLLHKQRTAPFDGADLNRGYPIPQKARGVSPAIQEKLAGLVMDHDLIIDLHTFMRPCLSAALALKQSSEANQTLLSQILQTLNTEIVINMDPGGEEKRVNSALGFYAIGQNIFFVAIEYPPIQCVNDEQIDAYSQGLKQALSVAGVLGGQNIIDQHNHLMCFERQQIISRQSGLFEPLKKLGEEIKAGEAFGRIIDIKTLSSDPICSPYSGKIIEISGRQFYMYGEKLATIGKSVL
ncbi:succinylglutamate desuccinylase/aspartoacylase family protein [Patescibacteria group bacterium]|nr:succinylglutamate desuccinylase/aspartoacylase family protein [Patescibacteria group bacterium]